MKYILLLILPYLLFAQSSFITPMEYASSFYKNPRGIGCQKCHGNKGNGKLVATYTYKNKKRYFRGPKINNMDFKKFYIALNSRQRGMPRYYLTKGEVQALYLFLNKRRVHK